MNMYSLAFQTIVTIFIIIKPWKQWTEDNRQKEEGGVLFYIRVPRSATNLVVQAGINGESDLKRVSMSNHFLDVKTGGELRVLDSFNCPHCPDHCQPFSDTKALNNHI